MIMLEKTQILNRKQRCFMGEGVVRRDVLCNAACGHWIGTCLSHQSFPDFLYNNSLPPSILGFLIQLPIFFFFPFLINSKWAWPRFDNQLLIPTSQAELTCSTSPDSITLENSNTRQVSQFHEVEAVSKQSRAPVLEVWHKGFTEIY